MDLIDVIVIGAGPAGLTAATYLKRFHRSCLVLDAGQSRVRWIPESNNCPGFPYGVSGPALLLRMQEQAASVEVPIEQARVDRIAHDGERFELTAGARRWRSRMVVLATGIVDRLPDESWIAQAIACRAIRLCAICDAYEATDLRIGVFGPSEVVAGHARFLRSYSSAVSVLPTDTGDGGAAGQRARDAGVDWLPAGGRLQFDGQRCRYAVPGRDPIDFDAVYPYLGCETIAGIAAAAGAEVTADGQVVVDVDQQTRLPGLYAIGDIVSGLNQIAVAVGQAAVAATHAHNRLPFVARAAVAAA